jgi:hypothetical protein
MAGAARSRLGCDHGSRLECDLRVRGSGERWLVRLDHRWSVIWGFGECAMAGAVRSRLECDQEAELKCVPRARQPENPAPYPASLNTPLTHRSNCSSENLATGIPSARSLSASYLESCPLPSIST